jgi:hypothetical protein
VAAFLPLGAAEVSQRLRNQAPLAVVAVFPQHGVGLRLATAGNPGGPDGVAFMDICRERIFLGFIGLTCCSGS